MKFQLTGDSGSFSDNPIQYIVNALQSLKEVITEVWQRVRGNMKVRLKKCEITISFIYVTFFLTKLLHWKEKHRKVQDIAIKNWKHSQQKHEWKRENREDVWDGTEANWQRLSYNNLKGFKRNWTEGRARVNVDRCGGRRRGEIDGGNTVFRQTEKHERHREKKKQDEDTQPLVMHIHLNIQIHNITLLCLM